MKNSNLIIHIKKQTAKILEIKPHDESKIVLVSLFE
tara:strand:+ start:243 stop:350 length:108 start_codon:yes stop_codon:yes gene_type:complete